MDGAVIAMMLQSAFEYLTTYSWVILISAIILIGLYSLGIFNFGNYAIQQCIISGGFGCLSYTMNTNGWVSLKLLQDTSTPINVTGIACYQTVYNSLFMIPPYHPPTNQVYMTVGSTQNFTVQCYTAVGSTYNGVRGSTFEGYIAINYTSISYVRSANNNGIVTGALVVQITH